MQTLLLISLIFAPLAFGSVEPWAFGLLEISAFSSAAFLFARGRTTRPNPLYNNLLPAVLAIALIGLLQAIKETPINAPSSLIFTVWRPGTLGAVNLWLFYAAVLFIVPQIITTPARFKKLMWLMFGMGVLVTIAAMFQRTGNNDIVYGLRRVSRSQSFGPFINRDHAAHFLAITAMVGLGIFFSGFRELRDPQSLGRRIDAVATQFLKIIMIGSLVYGIVRCGSRGGLLALAFAAAVTGFIAAGFIYGKKLRLAARAAIIMVLIGCGTLSTSLPQFLNPAKNDVNDSVNTRLSLYKSSVEMFKDFPLAGVGLGAVEHAFPFYKRQDIDPLKIVRHVHSDWFELFLQTGLLGGLIYISGLIGALRRLFKTWTSCQSFRLKAYYGGALGGVLAAMAHNLMDFGSQTPANALFFYTLLGALASTPPTLPRGACPEEEPPPAIPGKIFSAAAIAAAFMLCLSTAPAAIAWWYDLSSNAKNTTYEDKVKYKAAALGWDPDPQYAFRLAAVYFNRAIEQDPPSRPLLDNSLQVILPYLKRTPVNYDINRLNERILNLQSRARQGAPG